MKIKLSGKRGEGLSILVDDDVGEVVSDAKWFLATGGYAYSNRLGLLHRLVMSPTDFEVVDHINGDKLDNRRANLRVCSQKDNMRNQKKRNYKNPSSPYKGVRLYKSRKSKPWASHIRIDGLGDIHLGYYPTSELAAKAYDSAAREYYGEYAQTNFPGTEKSTVEEIRRVARYGN